MASKFLSDHVSKFHRFMMDYLPDNLSSPVPMALAFTAGSLGIWLGWRSWKKRNQQLPPSPRGWPVLGNMLDLSEDFHLDLLRLQKTNNLPDVFTLKIGPSKRLVILNSNDAIKDGFVTQGDLFSNRPFSAVMEVMQIKGELTNDFLDPSFKEDKAFIMSTMRSLGFGVGSEDRILEQMEHNVMTILDKSCEEKQPTEVSSLFSKMSTAIIFQILFGKVYEFDDPEFLERTELIRKWYRTLATIYHIDLLPFWLGKLVAGKEPFAISEENRKYIREEIREHLKTIDYNEPRDFVDAYLTKKKASVDEDRLANTILIFLPDTTDTVGLVSDWTILLAVHNPSIKARMEAEIKKVTGGNRLVKWSDRPDLPYVEAVIVEVMRNKCLAKFSGEHSTIRDSYFRGYFIPKGTPVIANLYAALMDPEIFENPEEFNPDRWLTSEGKLQRMDKWMPFGLGRRMCVGEQITRIQAFLTVTNLIQRYNMSFPKDEAEPSLEPVKGTMTTTPAPFKLLFELKK